MWLPVDWLSLENTQNHMIWLQGEKGITNCVRCRVAPINRIQWSTLYNIKICWNPSACRTNRISNGHLLRLLKHRQKLKIPSDKFTYRFMSSHELQGKIRFDQGDPSKNTTSCPWNRHSRPKYRKRWWSFVRYNAGYTCIISILNPIPTHVYK